jgi:hypothetical protein
MRFRVASVCTLALLAASYALPGHARGIRVDDAIACPMTPLSQSGTVALPAFGSASANYASSGISGFYVWTCTYQPWLDTTTAPSDFFSVSGSNNVFNTWIDLQGQNPSVVYANNPLSSLQGSGLVNLVGQVNAYQLTGLLEGYQGNLTNVAGDYEVEFDYPNYGESNSSCAQNSASFKWFGVSYSFTGAGGVLLCNASNDFLFNGSGQLLGYLNDSGSLVNGGGLAGSGWSKATSAPEPDTLLLLGLTGVPMLLGVARLKRAGAAGARARA